MTTMNAENHYLGYIYQGHRVTYDPITQQKVWIECKDYLMTKEPYLFSDDTPSINHKGALLNNNELLTQPRPLYSKSSSPMGPSQYQLFLKEKIAEYSVTHLQLTKKERYNLILEQWRTTKQKSKT